MEIPDGHGSIDRFRADNPWTIEAEAFIGNRGKKSSISVVLTKLRFEDKTIIVATRYKNGVMMQGENADRVYEGWFKSNALYDGLVTQGCDPKLIDAAIALDKIYNVQGIIPDASSDVMEFWRANSEMMSHLYRAHTQRERAKYFREPPIS